jgi:hypothetical protein
METSAIIMLIVGAVILWGGTAYTIMIAMRGQGFK